MFALLVALVAALSVTMLGSGIANLLGNAVQAQLMAEVGFPADRMWLLSVCGLAGGLGLIAGLAWWPLGVAAAAGSCLYFLGALAFHARAGSAGRQAVPAGALVVVAALVLMLRVATV